MIEAAEYQAKKNPAPEKQQGEQTLVTYMRRTTFGPASKPTPAGQLSPYSPFRPDVWLGFNKGCNAWLSYEGNDTEVTLSQISLDPKDSDWVTLEVGLDLACLEQTGFAAVALKAAASTTLRVDAMLRWPQAESRTGFVDSPAQHFLLHPEMQEYPVQFFLDAETRARVAPSKNFTRPLAIFFFPLRPFNLQLSEIIAGPCAPPRPTFDQTFPIDTTPNEVAADPSAQGS